MTSDTSRPTSAWSIREHDHADTSRRTEKDRREDQIDQAQGGGAHDDTCAALQVSSRGWSEWSERRRNPYSHVSRGLRRFFPADRTHEDRRGATYPDRLRSSRREHREHGRL